MASVDPFAVTCFATINTYAYIGTSLNAESKFCAPKGVTVQQMIRVAVKYMEIVPPSYIILSVLCPWSPYTSRGPVQNKTPSLGRGCSWGCG